MHRWHRVILVGLTLCAAAGLTAALAGYSTRDALGAVVSGCVLNKTISGSAFPCAAVEQDRATSAYALIRPPGNPTEVLIVPTANLPGIEAPALREPAGALYWQAAWNARNTVAAALGHPLGREAVALAVNSGWARSQDRFHIHVDCLGEEEQQAFAAHRGAVTAQWSLFPEKLEDRPFWVRAVSGSDLAAINPIALMLQGLPFARMAPEDMSLAVVGATLPDGSDGFYLVAEQALPRTPGTGSTEDLLDHACGRH